MGRLMYASSRQVPIIGYADVLLVHVHVTHTVSCRYSVLHDMRRLNQVAIAAGSHLFPFRTEKLSPSSPMVLQCNAGE